MLSDLGALAPIAATIFVVRSELPSAGHKVYEETRLCPLRWVGSDGTASRKDFVATATVCHHVLQRLTDKCKAPTPFQWILS